jgi:quercetin dioxygenase-like cupin family protein
MKSVIFAALLGVFPSAAWSADRMVPAEHIPWAVEAPGQPQRLGPLWGVRATGPAGTLLKVPGRWDAPVHTHTADYRAIVVEGVWKHWKESGSKAAAPELRPGSYWTQKARQWHADACVSATPCVILLINTKPYRTIVKKG